MQGQKMLFEISRYQTIQMQLKSINIFSRMLTIFRRPSNASNSLILQVWEEEGEEKLAFLSSSILGVDFIVAFGILWNPLDLGRLRSRQYLEPCFI